MKRLFLSLLVIVFNLSSFAQDIPFQELDSVKRTEYLINLAREVVQNFGPDYYKPSHIVEVADTTTVFDTTFDHPVIKKSLGRRYYVISFFCDKIKKEKGLYAAQVGIWVDNGEPFCVDFYERIGIHFLLRPYRQWIKEGVKETEKYYTDPSDCGC